MRAVSCATCAFSASNSSCEGAIKGKVTREQPHRKQKPNRRDTESLSSRRKTSRELTRTRPNARESTQKNEYQDKRRRKTENTKRDLEDVNVNHRKPRRIQRITVQRTRRTQRSGACNEKTLPLSTLTTLKNHNLTTDG